MADLSLNEIANSGKTLKVYVRNTVAMLKKLGERLHYTACMTVFHAAEYGDASHLNAFFDGLKVNDQTALKRWIADNFTYENAEGGSVNWISFTTKADKQGNPTNFYVVKGTEENRKGAYDLNDLLGMKSFQETDVSKPKVYDLAALLDMVIKAADTAAKKAEPSKTREGVELPPQVATFFANIVHDANKFKELVADNDKSTEQVEQKQIGNA